MKPAAPVPAYKPIPVENAREIARGFDKSMVVILAYDPVHHLTHTTTYGVSPEEKERAADVGDRCAKFICGDGFNERTVHEDYRFVDAGRRQVVLDQLRNAAAAAKGLIQNLLSDPKPFEDGTMPKETMLAVCDALDETIAAAKECK